MKADHVMRRGPLAGVAVALVVAGGLVTGCGGGGAEKPKGSDLTAVRCPLVSTGKQAGGVQQYAPAGDAFDTADLVGARVADARAEAARHGCNVVVSMRDGEGLPVATDIDPKRIYVYTEHDVVTQIEGVGGGI